MYVNWQGHPNSDEFWATPCNGQAVKFGEESFNMGKIPPWLHEHGAPDGKWLYVRGVTDGNGEITTLEYQEEPFDDDREREWDKRIYEAMIPEEIRNGVRRLRPHEPDDPLMEHTESALYTKEEYLAFPGADPTAFDREPHIEADNIKAAKFYEYPVGTLIHVLDPDTLYISAVNPAWCGGFMWASGFEEGNIEDPKWDSLKKEGG
jgi:hypothetical protein